MYQRIKAALISPRSNLNYVKDRPFKFVIYILIYIILFTLPYLPILFDIGSNIASTLASQSSFTEEINFEIKDQTLLPIDDAKTMIMKFNEGSFYQTYLIVGHNVEEDFSSWKQVLLIHLDTDGIYYMNRDGTNSSKIVDYDNEYLDLRKLNDNDRETINKFYGYVTKYINQHLGLVYGIGIPSLFFYNSFIVFGIALFMSVVGMISFRGARLQFKESFKLTILSMAPVVICFMFSVFMKRNLFGNLLYWLGLIISSVFFYRLAAMYIFVKNQNNKENIL